MYKDVLLGRLDALAASAAATGHALAVLALGSVGLDMARIDQYSDLDVWIIAAEGYKQSLLDDLGWLTSVHPIAYKYMHGSSGYSLIFADGIYAEVDVFDVADLATLGYTEARIVWKAEGVADSIRLPKQPPSRTTRPLDVLLGEVLGNLYVGLGRYHRGEKLTAMRFIQVYAIDRILELADLIEEEQPAWRDPFGNERRFERRFPVVARELPNLLQGYERTPESARAILAFLDKHFGVDAAMKQAITGLLAGPLPEK